MTVPPVPDPVPIEPEPTPPDPDEPGRPPVPIDRLGMPKAAGAPCAPATTW